MAKVNVPLQPEEKDIFDRFSKNKGMKFVVDNIINKIHNANEEKQRMNETTSYLDRTIHGVIGKHISDKLSDIEIDLQSLKKQITENVFLKNLLYLDERKEIVSFLINENLILSDVFFYNNKSSIVITYLENQLEPTRFNHPDNRLYRNELIEYAAIAISNNPHAIELDTLHNERKQMIDEQYIKYLL
jgi:hypothetical protein